MAAPTKFDTRWNNKTRVKSYSLVDYMTYEKWNVVLGVHKHEAVSNAYKYKNANSSEVTGIDRTKSDDTSPTYGLIYHPNENMSIYASHSENFDCGVGVSTQYANFGDVLPPLKTKQNEIGVKYMKNDLLWTLAYYDLKQDNQMAVNKPGIDKSFLSKDGEARHKGVELSVNGKLSDKWNVFGGLSHLDAKQEKQQKVSWMAFVSTAPVSGRLSSGQNTTRMNPGASLAAASIPAEPRS